MVVRQVGDDVLGAALREIRLFGVAAHIGKGQYRDRRLLRRWSCRSGRGARCRDYLIRRPIEANAMDWHRPGDVLDLVFAHVLERKMELVAHLIAHVAADADPDRKSTRLNSSHLGISYAVFCLKKKKNNKDL